MEMNYCFKKSHSFVLTAYSIGTKISDESNLDMDNLKLDIFEFDYNIKIDIYLVQLIISRFKIIRK